MLFELLEWGTSVVFGGDLGQSYLGTQGDEWTRTGHGAGQSRRAHRDGHYRRH